MGQKIEEKSKPNITAPIDGSWSCNSSYGGTLKYVHISALMSPSQDHVYI